MRGGGGIKEKKREEKQREGGGTDGMAKLYALMWNPVRNVELVLGVGRIGGEGE